MEDQDRRTPDEEEEVEGHAKEIMDAQEVMARDDDDFEGHALRDVQDAQEVMRGDDEAQEVL